MGFLRTASRVRTTGIPASFRRAAFLAVLAVSAAGAVDAARAFTRGEKQTFQKTIVDRCSRIDPAYRKIKRRSTRYIVVHTSEGGLESTLRSVSRGKRTRSGRRTRGGHAHYVIARNGRVYRTLDKQYVADHAGRSMWDGRTNISEVSVGIELVGYHYGRITDKQYRSVGLLVEILQRIYGLDDKAVLTHSQVAYGGANRWIKRPHRGRKRCAKNFDRQKAGLSPTWDFDPDVKAGRLAADTELAAIYYSPRTPPSAGTAGNVISGANTAWRIAGDEYDSPSTLYRLPSGKVITGDQVGARIGWKRIPKNTVVLLNQQSPPPGRDDHGPVRKIDDGYTAWDIAGMDYNKETTFYFFPHGHVADGREVSDWDGLPANTRIIVGYRGPYQVTPGRPAGKIAGARYNKKETLYYFPNRKIVSGDSVRDFKRLPKGVLIFLPEQG